MRLILEGLEYLECVAVTEVEIQNQDIWFEVTHSHVRFGYATGFPDDRETGDLIELMNQCATQGDAVFHNVNA